MNFKKALVASTAITAVVGLGVATAQAQAPQLSISGTYDVYAGVGDGDRPGLEGSGTPNYSGAPESTFAIAHYGNLNFAAQGQTDEGMRYGVLYRFQINEGTQGRNRAVIDKAYVWMSGGWGRVNLGGWSGYRPNRTAVRLHSLDRRMVDVFASARTGPRTLVTDNGDGSGFARRGVRMQGTSDNTKITYITPRMNGFQAGLSWTPNQGSDGRQMSRGTDSYQGGVDWQGDVGDGRLGIALALEQAAGQAVDVGDVDQQSQNNFAWMLSANYSTGPWAVAAGYANQGKWRRFENDGRSHAWEIGGSWSEGRIAVALTHMRAKAKHDPTNQTAKYNQTAVDLGYNLGGGLRTGAMVAFFDLDEPRDTVSRGNDGWVGFVNVNARF